MRRDSSPSRLNESTRVREPAKGSVGLMLGFVGGAVGVFFLILGALFLGFLAFYLIWLYSSIYLHR